jgi:chromosome segregation ATPase
MPRTRISETTGAWAILNQAVKPETTAGSPYLQEAHAKLQGFLEEVRRLQAEQADHQARKQEATRRINEILDEGRRLASNIRRVLKVELGVENEELARFGIQPLRRKKRPKKAADAAAAPPKSSHPPAK